MLNCVNTFMCQKVSEMPRHAPELECSVEDKESLVALAKSRTAESRAVERARMILACLEGKEIQQVARATLASSATCCLQLADPTGSSRY